MKYQQNRIAKWALVASLLFPVCSPKYQKTENVKVEEAKLEETISDIEAKDKIDLSNWPTSFWYDTKIIIPRKSSYTSASDKKSPYLAPADTLKVAIFKDMNTFAFKANKAKDSLMMMVFYDDQIRSLRDKNTIIISCENRWAPEFLDGQDCYKGLKKGVARIEARSFGGKLAMLITGYEPSDIMNAAQYLINCDPDELKGLSRKEIRTK